MQYAAVHARQRYAGEQCQCRRDISRTGFGCVLSPSDPFAHEEQGNSCIVVVAGAVRRPGTFADQPIGPRDDDDVARSIWIVPVGQTPKERVAAAAGVLDFIPRIRRLDSWHGSKRFPKSSDEGRPSAEAFHDARLEVDVELRKGRDMLARSKFVECAFNSLSYEGSRCPAGVQSCAHGALGNWCHSVVACESDGVVAGANRTVEA